MGSLSSRGRMWELQVSKFGSMQGHRFSRVSPSSRTSMQIIRSALLQVCKHGLEDPGQRSSGGRSWEKVGSGDLEGPFQLLAAMIL